WRGIGSEVAVAQKFQDALGSLHHVIAEIEIDWQALECGREIEPALPNSLLVILVIDYLHARRESALRCAAINIPARRIRAGLRTGECAVIDDCIDWNGASEARVCRIYDLH